MDKETSRANTALLALLELSLGGFWTIIGTINRVSVQKWQNNDNVTMNVLYSSADPIKITDQFAKLIQLYYCILLSGRLNKLKYVQNAKGNEKMLIVMYCPEQFSREWK